LPFGPKLFYLDSILVCFKSWKFAIVFDTYAGF